MGGGAPVIERTNPGGDCFRALPAGFAATAF
ncbi:hypothetical protein XBFFL1_280005 [Xenorhabdus bovienii str. feltiae Florida]|nr:hypothetical protein XBFFR1_660005 [Xenorhabdus bovienii str. feltiae France]CDG93924.1 hypothetical protein XBFFL1_280005 [Xenorhabdus bovienii str. feltiae Florida]